MSDTPRYDPRYDPRAERAACPNKANHTACPETYIAWHAWAEKISKTHWQTLCPGCDYWVIWVAKSG